MPKKKRTASAWRLLTGTEIAEALEDQETLTQLVEPCQAIYIWRRSFRPPEKAASESDVLIRWTEEILATPHGATRRKRLGHFVQIDGLLLQGAGLTADKSVTLRQLARSPGWRRLLVKFMASLGDFAPPLYVGETCNLPNRLKEHVNGDTGFGRKVMSSELLKWMDLDLHYYPLGAAQDEQESKPQAKARRTLLEFIATGASLAGYVDRPG